MKANMHLRNVFFYTAGIGFLALAKAKHVLQGYSSPKPFDISETARCIEYDMRVAEEWIAHLKKYTNNTVSLAGKSVLELGPGSDSGIGVYLLAKGCSQYKAISAETQLGAHGLSPREAHNPRIGRKRGFDHASEQDSVSTWYVPERAHRAFWNRGPV